MDAQSTRELLAECSRLGGADRSVWRAADGESHGAVNQDWRCHPAWSRAIDWGWIGRMGSGPAIATPRRSPRFLGRRSPPAWVATVTGPGETHAALILEGSSTCAVRAEHLTTWARLLASLEIAESAAGSGAIVERLLRAGAESTCVAHDLRHLLTVAALELESPDLDRDRVHRPLEEAARLCRGALIDETARGCVELLRLRPPIEAEARTAERVGAAERDVSIVVECPDDLEILADRSALSRLLRNAMLNAIQASPEGTSARVGASRRADGSVELAIEDQGRGMGRGDIDRLFGPGRSRSGGAGFGTLSLTQSATLLDAALSVVSSPGQGTRVIVTLPGSPSVPAFVLVDRDARRRCAIRQALGERGFGVREVLADADATPCLQRPGSVGIAVARGEAGVDLVNLDRAAAVEGLPIASYGTSHGSPAACADHIERVLTSCPVRRPRSRS